MKEEIVTLIKAERRRADFGYITEIVQRGHNKPVKYVHSITMPVYLYEEFVSNNVIIPEDYFITESAFFEFKDEEVIISFVNLYNAEDLHRRMLTYLVVKFAGSCPIKRTGVSKMNFDRRLLPNIKV